MKYKKIYIETLGCPKNFNDSEGIAGICENAGMAIVNDPCDADVVIVNTCGFINDAKTESINTIFDMIRLKRPMLVVCGCLSQRYSSELADGMPEVDYFLGVNDYERLPEIIEGNGDGNERICIGSAPKCFTEFSARRLGDNPYSSTLRIAEGCNNCCAYCVIPQIRGGYRSRQMESIIAEANQLAASGTSELLLIAQDVTEYGRDLYGTLKLPELLQKLCQIDGIRWIRLMYCYEDKITDELIDVMASEKKICKYIDIPLQHISNNILRSMRRKSTYASIRDTIVRLRSAIPDIHIRTTFITGFPGETENDFEELADFVEETRFERLGVFAYSQEEGTPAGEMDCQIEEDVKAERADYIMRHQVEISREINEDKIGRILEVIVEGTDDERSYDAALGNNEDITYIGRTEYDAPEIDGDVIFRVPKGSEKLRPGDFVNVRIDDAFDYDLVGTLIE